MPWLCFEHWPCASVLFLKTKACHHSVGGGMVMVTPRRGHWTCSKNDKEEEANIRGPGRTSLAKNTGKVQAEMSLVVWS